MEQLQICTWAPELHQYLFTQFCPLLGLPLRAAQYEIAIRKTNKVRGIIKEGTMNKPENGTVLYRS